MVQGYYSLEQAAEVLGMPQEELNRMARSREIRAFADGGSWKFRQQDIEELKRTRQYGSDPEIQLSDSSSSILEDDDDHVLSAAPPPPGEADSAPTVIGMRGQPRENESDVRLEVSKEASDSDVKLVPDTGSGSAPEIAIDDLVPIGDDIVGAPSDSDIRMTFEDSVVPKKSKESMDRTEEIDLGGDAAAEDASEVGLTPSKKSGEDQFRLDDDLDVGFRIEGESDVNLVDLGDSEFDLPPPSKSGPKTPTPASKAKKKPVLEDSDSENLDLDDIRLEDDSDFVLADSAQIDSISTSDSGINLSAPDDSGISLEAEGGSDSEFEVSLDTEDSDLFGSDDMPAFKDDSSPKLAGKPKKAAAEEDSSEITGASDSDFELSIDDEFEVEEESGSEVVALDDEDEEEEDEDDYGDFADEEDTSPRPVLDTRSKVMVAAPTNPPWPGWMIGFLIATTIPLALCGIMMFELMRNMWSHQTPYSLDGSLILWVHDLAKTIGLAT